MFEVFSYHPQSGVKIGGLNAAQILETIKDPASILWLDIQDIDDNDIDLLTGVFNIHPLTIEDCIMVNSRPKVENFKDYLYLIMFSLDCNDKNSNKIKLGEIDFCLGKNFLITSHSDPIASLAVNKERIAKDSPIIKNGADFLSYAIIDSIVDSYFPVINGFDEAVDQMSDELFKDPTNQTLKKIYSLKNEIIHLRRTIGPQADVISLLARGDYQQVTPANAIYFRNIYDSLIRINDIVGTSRDIITGAMEAYVSVVSNRLNEIMKTLTVISTIVMPLTLIASIYGMNFKHMPEIGHRFGYPGVLLVMACITIIMLIYFKRRKWL